MIPSSYVPMPFEPLSSAVVVWNAYAPRFEPNDSIRKYTNPLYEVSYTNVERALFYWPEQLVQFYGGEATSSDVDAIVSSM